MHPDIKKFWEDYRGVEVKRFEGDIKNMFQYYQDADDDPQGVSIYIVGVINNGELQYPFEGNLKTEAEMLQIIRMKAFL